jgi:hypothetical protein
MRVACKRSAEKLNAKNAGCAFNDIDVFLIGEWQMTKRMAFGIGRKLAAPESAAQPRSPKLV